MVEKTRYSDEELQEFKKIILEKLEMARESYTMYMSVLTHSGDNSDEDTSPVYKGIDDGTIDMSREEAARLAQRQLKFIRNLEKALIRIENKTYGICRKTGKLISKERLRIVPHATLSIEAKLSREGED
ncbi:MAG: TraR/DksA family transcriptional regulator [Bacteroidales bacterium]|nr:TraR/DksA family transcriptional regulator [Bacteroidales bacterium]